MAPLELMRLDLYIVLFIRRMLMKFQPLEPWIMGNKSITPTNFYGNLKPSMEMVGFIGLDVCCDLFI